MESNHIKLHIPGEFFWAKKLTDDTASVDNILMNKEIGYCDIVKFNPENNEVISVLIKKSNTFKINYPTIGDVKEMYKIIYNHFEEKGISVEGMFIGVVLLSVPVGLPESVVEKLIKECPVKLELDEN